MTTHGVDKRVYNRVGEPMDWESRLALKARLEKVLSECLSDQFDCNITIKFKPEKEELESENSDTRQATQPSETSGSNRSAN